MKVFVPISDEILRQGPGRGQIVPFNPAFLQQRSERRARKGEPPNWITKSDHADAMRRLRSRRQAVEP